MIMKKILGVLMVFVLLVSCSKEYSDEVEQSDNFIEVNGVRHQIDKFYFDKFDFGIGSLNDKTYIEVVYGDMSFYDESAFMGKYIFFQDVWDEIKYLNVYDHNRMCGYDGFSADSYYYISKDSKGVYDVDINYQTSDCKLIVKYRGKVTEK